MFLHHILPFAQMLAMPRVVRDAARHAARRGAQPASRDDRDALATSSAVAHSARTERVYIGAHEESWAWLAACVAGSLDQARLLTSRISVGQWVRYRIHLDALPDACGVQLTPITDAVVRRLAAHPDAGDPNVASALAFWSHGLRGGFAWFEDGEPLCMQWLFTATDNAALRRLPVWSGMYQPIAPGTGQVEKLWTFSTARQRGIATRFANAIFQVAHSLGLRELHTHIHETNAAARLWAQRTGWTPDGTITRYAFDLPGLRRDTATVCVHRGRDDTLAN